MLIKKCIKENNMGKKYKNLLWNITLDEYIEVVERAQKEITKKN